MKETSKQVRGWAALAAVVACIAYMPILENGFVWDDAAKFGRVEGTAPLAATWTPSYWTLLSHEPPNAGYYRPVASWVFLGIGGASGLDPSAYHLASLVLHALASGLVALLAFRVGIGNCGAAVAGLAFALHPVHTEAVAFASDLTDLLATVGILLGVLAALGRRRWLFLLAYAMALGSKESAVILPALALLVLGSREGPGVFRKYASLWIGAGGILLAYLAIRWNVTQGVVGGIAPIAWDGAYLRLSEVGRSYLAGARMLVWPHPLIADTGPAGGAVAPDTALAMLGVAALLVAVMACWPTRRAAIWKIGIAWCFVAMLPTSNILPLPQPWAERFLLLPSVGFALAIGSWAESGWRKIGRPGAVLVAVLTVVACTGQIRARLPDWRDDASLWRSVLTERPDNPRALHNLALVESKNGNIQVALDLYDRALALAPRMETVNIARARLLASSGAVDSAVDALRNYLGRTPSSIAARRELCAVFEISERYGEAVAAYSEWLQLNPSDPRPLEGQIRCLEALGFHGEAARLRSPTAPDGDGSADRQSGIGHGELTPANAPDYSAPMIAGPGSP